MFFWRWNYCAGGGIKEVRFDFRASEDTTQANEWNSIAPIKSMISNET
jgi:hypothetical protein